MTAPPVPLVNRWSFWWHIAQRFLFLASGFWCLYAAVTDRPVTAFAWCGAAIGFMSMGQLIRNEQLKRGEVTDD